ncbi:Hypothetical Protein OBI_RACECAR_43 [Arthrobacter phage Racecar]|nr:hypothetical protein PBI_RACECAR_124 [Arthrobacter phage Racecar]QFG12799.1 hypothetical protein PBI_MIMI_121 [Arthrobacter phage Mimi]
MEITSKLPVRVLTLALQILNQYRARWAAYEYSCELDRKDGHTPHYCFHGTSRWTDYDNICGQCEDHGNYWDYETYARLALDEAIRRHQQTKEREALLIGLMKLGAPADKTFALGEWSQELMKL